jgi:hypothetical protein
MTGSPANRSFAVSRPAAAAPTRVERSEGTYTAAADDKARSNVTDSTRRPRLGALPGLDGFIVDVSSVLRCDTCAIAKLLS